MTDLTDERKLQITEDIAFTMGLDYFISMSCNAKCIYERLGDGECSPFNPFTDWNDAMRAADALGVFDYHIEKGTGGWLCDIYGNDGSGRQYFGSYSDRLTAFVMALHEIAKAKLEEE